MRQVLTCLGVCAALLGSAVFAQESAADWATMHEDVVVMEQLVSDTVQQALKAYKKDKTGVPPEVESWMLEMGVGELPEAMGREIYQEIWQLSEGVGTSGLYLPGYGALVTGRLQFALSKAPSPSATPEPEKETRWDEYRQRVLGVQRTRVKQERKAYDEELVGRVKDAIVGLLATEAKNFRALPEDERVTVFLYGPTCTDGIVNVVLQAPGSSAARTRSSLEYRVAIDSGGSKGWKPAAQRSVVIASVKGSDLAAQRDGKLTSEELKKKVEIFQR